MKIILIAILAALMPLIWIAATPTSKDNHLAVEITKNKLLKTKKTIELFRKKYGKLPENIAMIRVFGRTIWSDYNPYDGFGAPLHYLPLTETHYIVKSFGADSAEDTLSTYEDPSFLELPKDAKMPPLFTPPPSSSAYMQFYPAILLMGTRSGVSDFSARIFVDPVKKTRHLVVRNIRRPGHVMIAAHPRVEEFLWQPNGYELVFTASGSSRYADGIYIWNIFTNRTSNLLDDIKLKYSFTRSGHQNRYHISLAAINQAGSEIYAFIFANNGVPLDPKLFFSSKSFYRIKLTKNPNNPAKFFNLHGAYTANIAVLSPRINALTRNVQLPFTGKPAQVAWSNLPISGPLQQVFESWQDFSLKYAKTPLLPYSLFWLSSMYGQAYSELIGQRPKEAITLKAYGAELSGALAQLPVAPSYLQAMGEHIHRRLLYSTKLNYKLIELDIDSPIQKKQRSQ